MHIIQSSLKKLPSQMTIKMGSYRFYILLCLVIPAGSLQFTKRYSGGTLVKYYRNRTNVELRWEWTLSADEVMNPLKIRRYRKNNPLITEVILASFSPANTDTTKYTFNIVNQLKGYASIVIKDLTIQGNNKDGSKVDVMKANDVYVYTIELDVATSSNRREYTDNVELEVRKIPVMTTYPRNQLVSGGTVTFECVADGKPTPVITWEKIGSSQPLSSGSPLTIRNFAASNIGIYRCTAKSTGITQNASATATVQFSTCGPGCTKEELGIELIDLVYNYEYENPNYKKYKELKNKIETECLTAYAIGGKAIHKCEVLRFRRGGVIAVVELGWPTTTVGPEQPLLQAISDGNFAGYRVKKQFVGAEIPVITTYPRNQTVSGGTVTFECAADGKPTPVITWEKIGSSQALTDRSPLTITNFDTSKVGVYRCTAKSTGITQSASATAIVQFSTCGSGCTMEELGIELIDLVYNYEYENPSYNKYKKLKNQIETECLTAYAMKVKSIHKCEVMRFRRGSVVAVVELGWPTNTVDPKQPLLQAISDGTFAGYRVKNEFVPAMLTTAAPKHVITGSTTTTPIKTFVRVKTGISTEVPPESAATCSIAIGVCVTIIVLALLSNSVLGFLLWNKSSQLKEFTKNRAQLAMASNDHPVIAANYSNKAVIINRQPEVPTAPIYHDVFNVNHSTADHSNQLYQTLDTNSQQPAQTYQTLDVAKKNALTPVETSVPGNYQALQDTLPAAKLNRVV